MCAYVHVRAGICGGQKPWIPLELELVTVNCKVPNRDVGNQTLALYKSSKHYLSGPFTHCAKGEVGELLGPTVFFRQSASAPSSKPGGPQRDLTAAPVHGA